MFSHKVQAIILAAGKSTRFNTGRTKLLEKICGQEIILYTTRLLEKLNIPITLVVGYQKDAIMEIVSQFHPTTVQFSIQEEQKGTGHALMCTQKNWERDYILILNGDVPLVTPHIIESLYEAHMNNNAAISFVTAHNADPRIEGYGRVLQTEHGISIIEARDFVGDITEHCCINAGIYLVQKKFLLQCINNLIPRQNTHELYITDLVKIASDNGLTVKTVDAPFDLVRGINTLQELWAAEQIKRSELIKHWMERGVHFSVAHNVHLDIDVRIGSGTYIGCGTHLLKGSNIGKNCIIQEFSSIEGSFIGDNCNILPHSIIKDSTLSPEVQVGPFAYVHEQSAIGHHSTIGNFVEIKKSTLGSYTKAKHGAYLENAHVGTHVTIGAGTMTCTHNDQIHQTIIHDNVHIGAHCTLVAPLVIEKNAYTAAGSVITENVPNASLAIARARQINKDDYSQQLHDIKVPDKVTHSSSTIKSFLGALKTKNNHNSDIS